MRVLLIEPYEPLARALRRGLEEDGVTVDAVADRDDGGARMREQAYDAVVVDLDLANQGLELLEGWRRDGLTAPVVMLTVPGDGPDRARTDLGCYVVLNKPFRLEELLARVTTLAGSACSFRA